jgi:translation initiation factor 4E
MQKIEKENSLEEKPNISNNNLQKTKLSNKYIFWFRISDDIIKNQFQKQSIDSTEYENQVKKIGEFETIEDFWSLYQHIKKPDNCKQGIEIQMFKDPIKPMWEDEYNKKGGKLSLKLNKGYTTIIWEELILGIIGNILPKEINEGINGIVFSSKKESNILQIWFKDYNKNYYAELEQCIRDLIQIPNEVPIDIKKFFFEDDFKKGFNSEKNNQNNNYENKKYEKNNSYYNYQNHHSGYQNNNYKKNKGYYHK